MAGKSKPTVCLVDDDQAIHEALTLLGRAEGFHIMGFASAAGFLAKFDPGKIQCILLDVRMPGMTGLELLEILRQRKTPVPVILLTGHADVPLTVQAMNAGALDVVQKPIRPEFLTARLAAAFKVFADWQKVEQERKEIDRRIADLTNREAEVLDLMVSGMKNTAIAKHLGISRKTLDIHRNKVMVKMKARTWADLTRWRMLHQSGPGGACQIRPGSYLG